VNFLKTLPRPKVPTLAIELLTDHEVKRLPGSINTRTPCSARNCTVLTVLLDTGLLLSEVCGLTMKGVHLDGKRCFVKVMGKG
jgi:site-specific recombinase XerD